jgi:hypothetical protein
VAAHFEAEERERGGGWGELGRRVGARRKLWERRERLFIFEGREYLIC